MQPQRFLIFDRDAKFNADVVATVEDYGSAAHANRLAKSVAVRGGSGRVVGLCIPDGKQSHFLAATRWLSDSIRTLPATLTAILETQDAITRQKKASC